MLPDTSIARITPRFSEASSTRCASSTSTAASRSRAVNAPGGSPATEEPLASSTVTTARKSG